MKSTMQEIPLSVARILEYGASVHRNTTVTTYFDETAEQTSFLHIGIRAGAMANMFTDEFGIGRGDRVGTVLPNCTEHLEVMLAVASMGAVFNPINRHLMGKQITHIINKAAPKVLVIDATCGEQIIPLLADCPCVEAVLVIGAAQENTDAVQKLVDEHLENLRVFNLETCLDGRSADFDWPDLEETAPAAICFSTGTEGPPKGVVYSHRALWLHSMQLRAADSFSIRNGTSFLCCVPIYHVLSWGVPLAAFMAGAPIVFTGHSTEPEHLAHVIADAMPRQAHGSPAVWTGLLVHYAKQHPKKMSLQEIYVGGSQVSPAMIDAWEERFGVDIIHAWGMTETGPVGTVAHPPAGVAGAARAKYRESQGRFHAGMRYRIVDDNDNVLDTNDRNEGELQVRGNTVTGSYFEDDASRFTPDGWLRTGDIATVNKDGYLTIHDRKSDIIRSGGEWIYSAALENYLLEPAAVIEAAVIGIPSEKWGQRPLAVVVVAEGTPWTAETARKLADELRERVPGWMVPENWTFVDHIDKTSVDKFDKKDLRQHFREGKFEIITV
ncbi:long-chain fatty-acid--CoA ligase [Corynebacterium macclintockiae]|uniref:long-chain fatty-acid--CoA ligase n=1 Tax=Corynebacterium macclintockiae TaxID=2913501 RepID=UPI00254BBD95|nr:long-chain fatty-acid--CoA ligase [Corynebacterium macclintockiae]MDK8890689.1 long-chain fatty-acid--CoA ligase [Corynebacterium macclintockiae]